MMHGLRTRPGTWIIPLIAALANAASATSFVLVSDADLVTQAELIAEVEVLAERPAPPAPLPETEVEVRLLRALKGTAPGESFTVRIPGGVGTDGVGLKVWGAPAFEPRARVLAFLVRGNNGTYRFLHLMLGAFHEVETGGRWVALRDLSQASEVKVTNGGGLEINEGPLDLPRDAARFASWIARGGQGAPDYFVPREEIPDAFSKFAFLTAEDGLRIRWFDFDHNQTIRWQSDSTGQPGLDGGGAAELQRAIAAWNGDPTTTITYVYNGTTSDRTIGCDGLNRVGKLIFDDPSGAIGGGFSCPGGGILAQGGPCFFETTENYRGQPHHVAADAYFVTNDGLACFFERSSSPARAAEELFAHELGHTLGLGHTTVGAALMNAFIHDDGRGAQLHADDRAGAAELYGNGSQPSPPAAPSGLAATAQSASAITLTWSDNANNETEFRLERRSSGNFAEIAVLGANSASFTANGLAAGTRYEFRVRAGNGDGLSAFSNLAAATTQPAGPTAPPAPSQLSATARSTSEIRLNWRDNASNETGFKVERRAYGAFQEIATLAANSTSYSVTGLTAASPFEFRVRAVNAQGNSPFSNVATANTQGTIGPCITNDTTLCLANGAVRIQVNWRNQRNGTEGVGHALPVSSKTGSFWFFTADNVELLVKALDGGPVNGHYWIFYGALSDVEYWVRATATATGEVSVYRNPPGEICGSADTEALELASSALDPFAKAGSCVPGAETLCLLGNRFEVKVEWERPSGERGTGKSVPVSDRTGYFWFFNAENLELVVKALDGRAQNGHFWFFYGALSNVEYTIRVRDTQTGALRTYQNPQGEICGAGDTEAF